MMKNRNETVTPELKNLVQDNFTIYKIIHLNNLILFYFNFVEFLKKNRIWDEIESA